VILKLTGKPSRESGIFIGYRVLSHLPQHFAGLLPRILLRFAGIPRLGGFFPMHCHGVFLGFVLNPLSSKQADATHLGKARDSFPHGKNRGQWNRPVSLVETGMNLCL